MSDMKKYTFIVEFRGGTYISQYEALNVTDALQQWGKSLDSSIYTQRIVTKLQKDIASEENPVPIKGVENVWCCSFSPYNSFLLLNIVETV